MIRPATFGLWPNHSKFVPRLGCRSSADRYRTTQRTIPVTPGGVTLRFKLVIWRFEKLPGAGYVAQFIKNE